MRRAVAAPGENRGGGALEAARVLKTAMAGGTRDMCGTAEAEGACSTVARTAGAAAGFCGRAWQQEPGPLIAAVHSSVMWRQQA
jgi:hypothetical protein